MQIKTNKNPNLFFFIVQSHAFLLLCLRKLNLPFQAMISCGDFHPADKVQLLHC